MPSASGAQSAIVTSAGEPIHTDRDHRVIVQQHWQRGGNAASRLDHPRAVNAPADASSGTWARVMTPMAGANWGSAMLPRAGQEVLLTYLEGDIDRPVVVAGVYNGQGNIDVPYNQQAGGPSGATGNAAAWFTGNDHAGVLSGIKTQDLQTSQSGSGGYRQLQFDDTPGDVCVQARATCRGRADWPEGAGDVLAPKMATAAQGCRWSTLDVLQTLVGETGFEPATSTSRT